MAGNADNIIIGACTISIDAVDVGFTKGGTRIRYEPEFIQVMADQAVGTVKIGRSNERMYVVTTLLEATLDRIREAFNQPAGNLVGSTLTLGYNNSCTINEHELVLVGVGPSCGLRTITMLRAVALGNREYAMTREEEVAFEVEFECLKDANGHFGTMVDS